jgi:hypothetical protein
MTNWPPEQASPWPVETFAGLEATGTTGPPKANGQLRLRFEKASRLGLDPGAETHIAGLIVRHHKTIVAVDQENKNRGLPGRRPIRRLRRANHDGGHGALTSSPPPFCIFSLSLGPGRGVSRGRTAHSPEGPTSYHCCPRHRRVTCTAARRSAMHRVAIHQSRGSRERMMRHLCICLHKSQTHTAKTPPRTHRPSTPLESSMLVAAAVGEWIRHCNNPNWTCPTNACIRTRKDQLESVVVSGVSSSPT